MREERAENRTAVQAFVFSHIGLSRSAGNRSADESLCTKQPHMAKRRNTKMGPKQILYILDELQKLGFNDDAFCLLHHKQETGKRETIKGMRSYCEKTEAFTVDGNNERVLQRLEFVLKHIRDPENKKDFIELAKQSYKLIPP